MTVSTEKAKIAAYVPKEVKEDAERLAKAQNRTLSNLVGMLLEKAIKENQSLLSKEDV